MDDTCSYFWIDQPQGLEFVIPRNRTIQSNLQYAQLLPRHSLEILTIKSYQVTYEFNIISSEQHLHVVFFTNSVENFRVVHPNHQQRVDVHVATIITTHSAHSTWR